MDFLKIPLIWEGFSRPGKILSLLGSLQPIDSACQQAWSLLILLAFLDFLDFSEIAEPRTVAQKKGHKKNPLGPESKKHLLIKG